MSGKLLYLEGSLRRKLVKSEWIIRMELSLKLFIQALGIEDTGFIIHQRIEMPCFLVLGVHLGSPLAIEHYDPVVFLAQVVFVLVMPLP